MTVSSGFLGEEGGAFPITYSRLLLVFPPVCADSRVENVRLKVRHVRNEKRVLPPALLRCFPLLHGAVRGRTHLTAFDRSQ